LVKYIYLLVKIVGLSAAIELAGLQVLASALQQGS
jgi:hypothetical protein